MDRIAKIIKEKLATKFDIEQPIYGILFNYDGNKFVDESKHITNVGEFIDAFLKCIVRDKLEDKKIEEILEDECFIENFDGKTFKHKTGFGFIIGETVCYAFTDKTVCYAFTDKNGVLCIHR